MKLALLSLLVGSAAAFAPGPAGVGSAASATSRRASSSSSSSEPSSRRDVLSTAASAAFGLSALVALDPPEAARAASFRTGPVTPQSAANKAAESYQGVYTDPNHPEGYRVVMASGGGKATMTLSDEGGVDAETYKNVPVGVSAGGDELSFDFGFKGGPKGVVAKLSEDKQTITFPDGNTWTKNSNQYDGVYKDPNHPKGYRVVRKFRGATKDIRFLAEVNDTGDAKDSKFVAGSYDSLLAIPAVAFTFYDYPGYAGETGGQAREKATDIVSYAMQGGFSNDPHPNETKLVGQFSLEDKNPRFPYGTITFPDGTVWTRI